MKKNIKRYQSKLPELYEFSDKAYQRKKNREALKKDAVKQSLLFSLQPTQKSIFSPNLINHAEIVKSVINSPKLKIRLAYREERKFMRFKNAGLNIAMLKFPLDKLAHLGKSGTTASEVKPEKLATLRKRAAAKYFTNIYLNELINLHSPLHKSYVNTNFCSNTLFQDGQKITSTYCKNRWCTVCNRNRTAHLINTYLPQVEKLNDKWFVTLSFQNVDGGAILKAAIDLYNVFWKSFYENYRDKYKTINKYLKKAGKPQKKLIGR